VGTLTLASNVFVRPRTRAGAARGYVGLGVGVLVQVEVGVGVLVQVGVGVGVLVQVGVGVGEFCPATGWVWAGLVGETVGEADLVGCAKAVAEILGRGEGPVVPRRGPPPEFRARAVEADAMSPATTNAAIQARRRRFLGCGRSAAPPPAAPPPAAPPPAAP
jgi:hypothetical protein